MPHIYDPFYENLVFDGPKILPNEKSLTFFANGHNNKSSFLSTYIEKCRNETKRNPLFKDLIFSNVTCAPKNEIDYFVNRINVEFYFNYHEIDISEKNIENTIF